MASETPTDGPGEASLAPDCAGCGLSLAPDDRFCRRCGQARGKPGPWQQRPGVILALLFLGIGPLALPMLWRSPRFSKAQKSAITAANLAFIAALVLGFAWLVRRYLQFISDLAGG